MTRQHARPFTTLELYGAARLDLDEYVSRELRHPVIWVKATLALFGILAICSLIFVQ